MKPSTQVDFGIRDRAALVTGGTRGIGLGIARALAAEGVRVAVAARTEADVRRVADELGGFGVAADLTTDHGCRRAFEASREALGRITILVNNVGMRFGNSWADTGVEEVTSAFAANLLPAIRISRLALADMEAEGWGRIVVISSLWGREAGGAPAYNLAKAAENSFATSLGREVAARGITVNAVAPGSILFEGGSWWRRQQQDPEAIADFVRREMPRGSMGTLEEVAAVVAFLCSRQASLVNAAVVAVDGGQGRSLI